MNRYSTKQHLLRFVGLSLLAAFALFPLFGPAKENKETKKEAARIIVAMPLGVAAGTPVKFTIRGLGLDAVTDVRFKEPKTRAKILGKKKVGVPNGQDAKLVGDSEAEIEATLPVDISSPTVDFVVVNAAGESAVHTLVVDRDLPVIGEKEPNNGFVQAQSIALPAAINGVIDHAQDVDVFRLEGKAGQRLTCEIYAARLGSPLDSLVTLYDAEGHSLASNDDHNGNADSLLEFTLPKDGVYFVSVMDANDQGGPAHVYRLSVIAK